MGLVPIIYITNRLFTYPIHGNNEIPNNERSLRWASFSNQVEVMFGAGALIAHNDVFDDHNE